MEEESSPLYFTDTPIEKLQSSRLAKENLIEKYNLMPLYSEFVYTKPVEKKVADHENNKINSKTPLNNQISSSTTTTNRTVTGGLTTFLPQSHIEPTLHHFLRHFPGSKESAENTYLRDLVLAPDRTADTHINLDSDIIREAFRIRPGPIPGLDTSFLLPSASEDNEPSDVAAIPAENFSLSRDSGQSKRKNGMGEVMGEHPKKRRRKEEGTWSQPTSRTAERMQCREG